MKRKWLLYIIIEVLAIIIVIQYTHNINIERKQGGMYKYNLDYLRTNVKRTREYLSDSKPLSYEDTEEYLWKYNEYVTLSANLPSYAGIGMYLDIMHVNFSRMSQAIKNNEPESNIKALKDTTLGLAINLENALDSINTSCGNDYLKYYRLNDYNNKTMIGINKALTDYLNKNNIQ